MKTFLLATMAIFFLSQNSFAESCVNLSGDYSTGAVGSNGRQIVWSLVQNGCNTIAVGSYTLSEGVKGEVIAPFITYVDSQSQNLCETRRCTLFHTTTEGIAFERNSLVDVGGYYCRYEHVQWSLDTDKNLKQSYTLNDTNAACKKLGTFAKILSKVR